MDDLTKTRTVTYCPVEHCPWEYDLTRPHTEERAGRLVLTVPPPAGVTPAERIAGIMAARPIMMAAPPAGIDGLLHKGARAANEQDDAVMARHLAGHTEADLAAALGGLLGLVLERIAGLDPHPPVTIDLPGADLPRLVAYWQDDGPASGYRCSVCRIVIACPDRMAEHFTDRHLVVSAGFHPRTAGEPVVSTVQAEAYEYDEGDALVDEPGLR